MARDYCTLSIYVPHRFYLPLLDLVAHDLGFRSRSLCLTQLLERLFLSKGMIDKHHRPTERAIAASKEVADLVRANKTQRGPAPRDSRRDVLDTVVQLSAAQLPERPRRHPRHQRHRRTRR